MTRIAIVGTCASGKTSISSALRNRGHDAYAVAQEHSAIPELWAHLKPERVVYLEASLKTVRRRRDDDAWPEWIYHVQVARLANARDSADLIVVTDDMTPDQIVEQICDDLDRLSSPE